MELAKETVESLYKELLELKTEKKQYDKDMNENIKTIESRLKEVVKKSK
jgi:hypothetical protein